MNSRRAFSCALLVSAAPALTQAEPFTDQFSLEIETGPAWFSRNDVRIPNEGGTRFDLLDLTGSGPEPYVRLYAHYQFDENHSVRLNLAPLEISGSGRFDQDVVFQDSNFSADAHTDGLYRFNTYRLTYRWMFRREGRWDLGLGAALLVRDAKIELRQAGLREQDDDLGLVPLLHFYGAYHVNERTQWIIDIEGAAASQGRAIDASLKIQYTLPDDSWYLSAGYRTLEGGADNDELYTFAWVHYASFGIGYNF
ncbi:hypothetical protein [Marinimicrobium sp. ABcell2]|uniref:hypothetical protein n=1 Tax=Marinimicrobium sp. ABcell2 TaxID=3069751 RepID=UPI0027B48957|nr:hypothetical protein [Marinimicrobium sp. ABcell2]MDQ2077883.1 hypothetical protein [Marinimicrobium sp. ABcell2]